MDVVLVCSWSVAAYWGILVCAALLIAVVPGAASDVVSMGALELLVLGACSHLMLHLHDEIAVRDAGASGYLQGYGLTRAAPMELLLGVGLGLSLKLPADLLRGLLEQVWPTPELDLAARAELMHHETPLQFLGLLVLIGLLAPLLEEVFYRGIGYRLLRRRNGALLAILVSSGCFVVAHGQPRDWPSLLGVALALGYARHLTGRLWTCVGAHVAFNSAALLMMLVQFDAGTEVSVSLALATFASLLACGLVMAALRKLSA